VPPRRGSGFDGADLFGAAPPPPGPPEPRQTAYSVTEVTGLLKAAVEGALGQVWIKGELAELRPHQSGHWYFTLRDAEAQIRCVMWRTYVQRARSRPAEGAEVFMLARPTFWEERCELRFTAVTILPTAGVGEQQLAQLQVRDALAHDGLFDPARKRRLPPYPETVALVTSMDGAALRDMATVARRRWPAVRLLVIGAAVQGDPAAQDLVRALGIVNRLAVDVCVVGRGGGAREDLAAFDTEPVCRAIAAVRVPVVCAVGHETDVTLADLVADVRAATPSAALELVLPDRAEVGGRIAHLGARLAQPLRRGIHLAAERLFRSEDRLRHAVVAGIRRDRDRVARLGGLLDALSPLRTVARGYAIARDPDGRVLRRVADLPSGTAFRLQVSDGSVPARVEGTA